MSRPKAFICSQFSPTPTSTREENVERARKFCRLAFGLGFNPFAPHLFSPQFLDDTKQEERQAGIDMGIQILKECQKVLVYVLDGFISPEMKIEIDEARFQGILVEFYKVTFRGNILGRIKNPQA